MIDPTFRNINRLFVQSSKFGGNDPARDSLDKYFMPLRDTKDFNVLINNKPFFKQLIKNKKHIKNISKCQEKITIQEETSCIICIIKILQPHWYRFIKREKHSQFSKN